MNNINADLLYTDSVFFGDNSWFEFLPSCAYTGAVYADDDKTTIPIIVYIKPVISKLNCVYSSSTSGGSDANILAKEKGVYGIYLNVRIKTPLYQKISDKYNYLELDFGSFNALLTSTVCYHGLGFQQGEFKLADGVTGNLKQMSVSNYNIFVETKTDQSGAPIVVSDPNNKNCTILCSGLPTDGNADAGCFKIFNFSTPTIKFIDTDSLIGGTVTLDKGNTYLYSLTCYVRKRWYVNFAYNSDPYRLNELPEAQWVTNNSYASVTTGQTSNVIEMDANRNLRFYYPPYNVNSYNSYDIKTTGWNSKANIASWGNKTGSFLPRSNMTLVANWNTPINSYPTITVNTPDYNVPIGYRSTDRWYYDKNTSVNYKKNTVNVSIPYNVINWCTVNNANFNGSMIANLYNILFQPGFTTNQTMNNMLNLLYGLTYNLSPCSYTRLGYNFSNWKYGNNYYSDKASVSNLTTNNGTTILLTAQWKKVYTISYYNNGWLPVSNVYKLYNSNNNIIETEINILSNILKCANNQNQNWITINPLEE